MAVRISRRRLTNWAQNPKSQRSAGRRLGARRRERCRTRSCCFKSISSATPARVPPVPRRTASLASRCTITKIALFMGKQLAQHRTQEQGSRIAAASHLNYEFAMYRGTAFGFRDGGWKLVTQRNCPNNTLPLFWANLDGIYTGPFPRNPSRISHLSLAPKRLDSSSLQGRRTLRKAVHSYLSVEGILEGFSQPVAFDEAMQHRFIDRVFADAASASDTRLEESRQRIQRLAQSDPRLLPMWENYLERCHKLLCEKTRNLPFLERLVLLGNVAFSLRPMELFQKRPQQELLWRLSRLRVANHDGQVEAAVALQARLLELEGLLADEDPALVVHSMLNRAVFATNLFDFDLAATIVRPWCGENEVQGIPAALRGAMLSSVGQEI